jgi:hypothetical protein
MPVTHSVSARAGSLGFYVMPIFAASNLCDRSLSDHAQRASAEHLGFVYEDEIRDEQNKLHSHPRHHQRCKEGCVPCTPIGPQPQAQANALPRFPKGGLWLPKGPAESTITLEAMGVAELLIADPLTRGRAVPRQLLTK